MFKRVAVVVPVMVFIIFSVPALAQADILEWKKMSFETANPVPVLDSMDDVRKVFASPLVCSGCHKHHYEEWGDSYHAMSVRNAGFQTLFLKYLDYLKMDDTKKALGREAGAEELRQCLFCHAPMMQFASDRLVQQIADAISKGRWEEIQDIQISCVVCHTITPEGKWTGSFSQAGTIYGPIKDPVSAKLSGHQSKFSPLHEKSKFCASCHSWKRFNVFCSLVFEQWERVKGAKQCQGCHMEVMAKREIAPGGKKRADHVHFFPGGRSIETRAKALGLSIDAKKTSGGEVQVQVTVRNKIAHNIPDG